MKNEGLKISIIGSALSGNKGAAAMLESSIQNISRAEPNVEFSLLSLYPKRDKGLNTFKKLKIINSKPLILGLVINPLALVYRLVPPLRGFLKQNQGLRAFVDADILLDQSGITFVDGRAKFLIYNIATILPAILVKTPVFKCAQALGPFNTTPNKQLARLLLPKVHTIISRGSATTRFLNNLGVRNFVEGADYAFALELENDDVMKYKKDSELDFLNIKQKFVGISPSVVVSKKLATKGVDYQKCISQFVDYLTEKDYHVLLVAHSAIEGSANLHNNDLPLCKDIYSRVANKRMCHFIDHELESQKLRFVIGHCDYFVASRFHAMVSSLAMSVPTMVIGWSHKYKEVLEMFKLQSYAHSYEGLSSKKLISRFNILEKNIDEVQERLTRYLPVVKKVSNEQTKLIIQIARSKG